MGYCIKGIADITFKDAKDKERFEELVEQYKGNQDAAWELLMREKAGETVSSASSLFDRDSLLVEDTLSNIPLTNSKDIERISKIVDNQKKALESRINDLRKSANSLKGLDKIDRDKTIEKLDNLLIGLEDLETRDQFIAIVDYASKDLSRISTWLEGGEKGFDASKEIHRDTLLAINRQLDTYAGLNVPEYAAKHSTLKQNIEDINRMYRDVKETLSSKTTEVLVALNDEYGTNPIYKGDDGKALFEQYLRESNDIDGLQALFIDIDTSSDPILALIGKLYAEKRQEVSDFVKERSSEIRAAGKELIDAGIENQDFMIDKKTARIVTKISSAFKEARDAVFALTDSLEVGDNGRKIKREYIKKPVTDLSDEEKKHNIDLASDKRTISQFMRAEYWDKEQKMLVDGENNKYTDEFKEARSTYESYEEGGWVKSGSVTQEQYDKYLKRYYGPTVTAYRMLKDAEGNATGEVEEYETRFVRSAYIEVTDKWNSAEYEQIQANPAMKKFYDFYVTTFSEIMDKLPADIAKTMDGKVLRIRDDFTTKLLSKKTPLIKRIVQKLKQLILPDIITNGRVLDEQGYPTNDIAIFYVGDLKSEKRIAELETEIELLAGNTSIDAKKRLAKLKNSLSIEQNKLTPEEVNYDLVESLSAGMQMATNYDVMKSIESTFLLAQEALHDRKYFEGKDKFGDPIKNSKGDRIQYKEQGTSKAEKRLETWMRMVFYNNSQANNTQIAKVAGLLKRYTSAVSVGGLAVFPAFNNIVTAEMSNIIEGFGGRFYKNKNYKRGFKLLASHLANPKWATHLFKPVGKYEDEKPYDLVTALVEHFNFLEENADRASGLKQKQTVGEYVKSGNVLYALTEGGEYAAQVNSALAYLDNKTIPVTSDFEYTDFEGNKKTTNGTISLLDAYVFDEASGKLSLRNGVVFDAKAKRSTTGEIRNMNKTIHGNHSSIDRVPIQENWYGELAFQFKRWMPNAIRSRFSNSYYDESVGLEMQGRYRAIQTMLSNLEGLSVQFTKDAWKKLTPLEQANMRKNMIEAVMWATALALYVIFDAIREGLPPDDEKTKAALNFLKQQAMRTRGEIDFFLNPIEWYKQTKSPVAGLRTFGEIAEFIHALTGVPYYTLIGKTKNLRYEKGVNKGDLKVGKEGRDLLPVLKQVSQFRQLDITGDFFIR